MMEKLKPCPFCGNSPRVKSGLNSEGKPFYQVTHDCMNLLSRIKTFCYETDPDAIAEWNRRAQPDITGETSDGYHTFNELYHHRAVLFSVICNTRPEIAWKSKQHHDGTMYDGMFIVGINTPDGQATYHYDVEPYWEMFRVKELPNAPEWDGHTPTQAIERIGKLSAQPDNAPLTLDELRGMDGEPVYLAYPNAPELDGWQILKGVDDEPDDDGMGVLFSDDIWEHAEDCGDSWIAYRRKPEPEGGDNKC